MLSGLLSKLVKYKDMQIFSKEELDAFKAEAARVLSEAETKATAKAADYVKRIKDEAAAIHNKQKRRAYLDRKQDEMRAYYRKERRLAIDLHGTDAETLTAILAAQLEEYAAGRSDTPPAYRIIRLSEVEAARITAQALAAELEGAKASSAEAMDDSETAEKARELLSKMKMLDSRGKINPPPDCEHKLNTIARALYRVLQPDMGGTYKAVRFSKLLAEHFSHRIDERNLRTDTAKHNEETALCAAFRALKK